MLPAQGLGRHDASIISLDSDLDDEEEPPDSTSGSSVTGQQALKVTLAYKLQAKVCKAVARVLRDADKPTRQATTASGSDQGKSRQ